MPPSDDTHDLVSTLQDRAREAAKNARCADFRARALEAAFAIGSRERAWARIRIAADLRAEGDHSAALNVLDQAWSLDPPEDARCAISTVAIAIHCDLGAHLTAEVIEREQAPRSVDVKFANAAARLYAELARVTDDEAHHHRRDHYAAMIDELEAGIAA